MRTVFNLVAKKGHTVWSIEPDAKVYDALLVMAEKNIGALLVIENKSLIGVISERDYARKIILRGKASRDVPVREIMSYPVITISMKDGLEKALELMTRNHIRHLPVVEGKDILGVLSMRDVMEAIIQNQDDTIRFLKDLASDTM